MASAIILGLVSKGVPKRNIIVSEPWDVNRSKLEAHGIATTLSSTEAAAGADRPLSRFASTASTLARAARTTSSRLFSQVQGPQRDGKTATKT